MITVKVKDKGIEAITDENLTSGSVGIKVHFDFNEKWQGLYKIAFFKVGKNIEPTILGFDGTDAEYPWELLTKKDIGKHVQIGVCGYNDIQNDVPIELIYPTTYTTIGTLQRGANLNDGLMIKPSDTLVIQLINKVTEVEKTAQEAKDIATQSKADVEKAFPKGGKTGQVLTKKSDDDLDTEWKDFEIKSEIDDTKPTLDSTYSSQKIEDILESPQYNNMIVTVTKNGLGSYSADYTSSEIRNWVNAGGIVELKYDDIDTQSGEQSYTYETFKDNYAIFRRVVVEQNVSYRINIKVDYQGIVTFEKVELDIPTSLSQLSQDSTHRVVTDVEKEQWNNKSEFSGNYDDLTNKPNIPTKTSELDNDSGYLTEHQSLLDYAKKSDLTPKADKTYVDEQLKSKQPVGNYATKEEIPTKTSELTNDNNFISNTVDDLVNYYKKSETYTQTEINNLVDAIPKFSIQVVNSLPIENISTTTIYLLKDGKEGNLYTEYIYVNNAWEILGSQQVDLSGYYTSTKVDELLAGKQPIGDYLKTTDISDWAKQPKKPIYTAVEVGALNKNTTLADLPQDAEHRTVTEAEKEKWNQGGSVSRVQSDWNVNDELDPAFIKNRFGGYDVIEKDYLINKTDAVFNFSEPDKYVLYFPDKEVYNKLQEGQFVVIDWGDKTYQSVVKRLNNSTLFIGDGSLFNQPHLQSTEPFCFNINKNQVFISTKEIRNKRTVKVRRSVPRTIDKKYLPADSLVIDTPYTQWKAEVWEQIQNAWNEHKKIFINLSFSGTPNYTLVLNAFFAYYPHIIVYSEPSNSLFRIAPADSGVGVDIKIYDVFLRDTSIISSNQYYKYLASLAIGASDTSAIGNYAFAQGKDVISSGDYSHAEGKSTSAKGSCSHAEGDRAIASGDYSHAEGIITSAKGNYSHAEGSQTESHGFYSHAEGFKTWSAGSCSHAEGNETSAKGNYSHAEGVKTYAKGDYSHAEGFETWSAGDHSHVQGQYNIPDTDDGTKAGTSLNKYAYIVGNGEAEDTRSNAHTLDWQGNGWYQGDVLCGGKDMDDPNAVSLKKVAENMNVLVSPNGTKYKLVVDDNGNLKTEKTV